MAKRKDLKKNINYICGELFTECVVVSNFTPNVDIDKAADIMSEILTVQNEFISRISHTGRGSEKLFYKKLYAEFNEKVQKIITELRSLN